MCACGDEQTGWLDFRQDQPAEKKRYRLEPGVITINMSMTSCQEYCHLWEMWDGLDIKVTTTSCFMANLETPSHGTETPLNKNPKNFPNQHSKHLWIALTQFEVNSLRVW